MLTASVNVVQSAWPEDVQGDISGVSRSVSNLGSSLGVAIAGSVARRGDRGARQPAVRHRDRRGGSLRGASAGSPPCCSPAPRRGLRTGRVVTAGRQPAGVTGPPGPLRETSGRAAPAGPGDRLPFRHGAHLDEVQRPGCAAAAACRAGPAGRSAPSAGWSAPAPRRGPPRRSPRGPPAARGRGPAVRTPGVAWAELLVVRGPLAHRPGAGRRPERTPGGPPRPGPPTLRDHGGGHVLLAG